MLGPGDLTTATMRLAGGTAALAYRQAIAVEGRALAVAVACAGELIQASMLVPAGAGNRPCARSAWPSTRSR